jgi:hypothetical protein
MVDATLGSVVERELDLIVRWLCGDNTRVCGDPYSAHTWQQPARSSWADGTVSPPILKSTRQPPERVGGSDKLIQHRRPYICWRVQKSAHKPLLAV